MFLLYHFLLLILEKWEHLSYLKKKLRTDNSQVIHLYLITPSLIHFEFLFQLDTQFYELLQLNYYMNLQAIIHHPNFSLYSLLINFLHQKISAFLIQTSSLFLHYEVAFEQLFYILLE